MRNGLTLAGASGYASTQLLTGKPHTEGERKITTQTNRMKKRVSNAALMQYIGVFFLAALLPSLTFSQTTNGTITPSTQAPLIDVWYGSSQPFGKSGTSQRRVNILGNVNDPLGIESLYYTVNGGTPVALSRGPDTRRLLMPGDFNADIPYNALLGGPGGNTIIITARNIGGQTTSSTVNVYNLSGNVTQLPYTVAWSSSSTLFDSAQVVDGKWWVTGGTVRPLERGYDRLIAIGDTTLTDYEVTVPMTIYGYDSSSAAFGPPSGGPAIGMIFRWKGHTNNPIAGQPLAGYLPLGAVGWLHWPSLGVQQWELMGNDLDVLAQTNAPVLQFGVTYYLKMHVHTEQGKGGFYALKTWRAGEAEPGNWLLTGNQALSDPQSGSFLLVAHHVSAAFGRVSVTAASEDMVPPVISSVRSTPGATSAYVAWTTDEVATSKVLYGRTTFYTDSVTGTGPLSTLHNVGLAGLTYNTLYHYRVVSEDGRGNRSASGDYTFTTLSAPPPTTLVSDDFSGTSLNTSLWTVINPFGDGTNGILADSALMLSVPGGIAHDLWTNGNEVYRILQNVNNADFEVEVKFNSPISASAQVQGIIIEQDLNNVLRFDFTNGITTGTRIFSARFKNGFGSPSVLIDNSIGQFGIAPLYLRVRRESNIWTESYSLDGSNWIVAGTFLDDIVVARVGLFMGNAGGTPPPFTSRVDYFRCGSSVSVAAVLQGSYLTAGDSMKTTLRSVLPIQQPYNSSPWNYTGTERVASSAAIPAGTVDWVLLELRTGTSSSTVVGRRAAFIRKDGRIVDLDGRSPVKFSATPRGDYYVVVRHRNHLAIMSGSPLPLGPSSSFYDFTTSMSKAYSSGASPMIAVGSRYALYAGDVNADGQIKLTLTNNDPNEIYVRLGGANINATVAGYYREDVNMDGVVKYNLPNNDRVMIPRNIGGTNINGTVTTQVP